MIRTLRATDLLRILLGNSGVGPDWAQTWEKVGTLPGSTLGPATVARELLLLGGMKCCSVWAEGTRLRALASVRARSGPRAWEVQCLHLSPEAEEEGVELLEGLCLAAGQRGGERVFLRVPALSPVVNVVKKAGFLPYAQEVLYRREKSPSHSSTSLKFLRSYLLSDEYPLFRLYTASTSSKLQVAHALTFDEWRDAREPPVRGESKGVYEDQGCLRGWVRVASCQGGANIIEMMLNPEEAGVGESLLAWGLQQGKAQSPFLALVPSHQTVMALVLEQRGFAPTGEYHVMVKSIAVRVNESALAPAGA